MTGIFALLCLTFAARFAFPSRFGPVLERSPAGSFRGIAGTNIVITLAGMPMHKSIGRAAVAGIVVSLPATLVAAFASGAAAPTRLGRISHLDGDRTGSGRGRMVWRAVGVSPRTI